jgi:phosphomannomutase/phosphoglucomutase
MADLAAQASVSTDGTYQVPDRYHIPYEVFRTYDIRGPVDENGITPDLAYSIGLAVGSEARLMNEGTIAVGRDGRLSGTVITDALCTGLLDSGIDVVYIGMVPSPVVYFTTTHISPTLPEVRSGVVVTASHNPGHHNGFKITIAGKTLREDGIKGIWKRLYNGDVVKCSIRGKLTTHDVVDEYIDYIVKTIKLERSLKVVVDCGNGVSGEIAPRLLEALGCKVIPLYCDIDGHFPNHHPDPTIPENLEDLIAKVKDSGADIGLALDGDGDRLGVVTSEGKIIWPDRQMMLYAIDVLSRKPGSEIIYDVKCSRHLKSVIHDHGGKPLMWRTGHSLIKAKLFEDNAPLAGEMSGHIFFRDDGWFGFDDGLYVAARLLRILAKDTRTSDEIFAALPNSVNTPELKVSIEEKQKVPFMYRLIHEGEFEGAEMIKIDGMRIEYPDGWALVRPSNTSAYLVVRFEAGDDEGMARIQKIVKTQMHRMDARLELPF